MPEFTASIEMFVPADRVFDYVRDLEHLPQWAPTLNRAEAQGRGDRVRVRGEAGGHPYDADGAWEVDRKAMRVEWGADGERDYGGSLTVSRAGRGARVDAVIRFGGISHAEAHGGEKAWQAHAQQGLEAALQSLKQVLEARGDGSERAAG